MAYRPRFDGEPAWESPLKIPNKCLVENGVWKHRPWGASSDGFTNADKPSPTSKLVHAMGGFLWAQASIGRLMIYCSRTSMALSRWGFSGGSRATTLIRRGYWFSYAESHGPKRSSEAGVSEGESLIRSFSKTGFTGSDCSKTRAGKVAGPKLTLEGV